MTANRIPFASREHIQFRKAQFKEHLKNNAEFREKRKQHLKQKLRAIKK